MNSRLTNVRAVVTRAKDQAEAFSSLLEGAGIKVIHFPTIEFSEPDDLSAINGAIDDLKKNKNAFAWIIFTSANGVKFFMKRLTALGADNSLLDSVRVAVVGPKTKEALEKLGVRVDLVPKDFRAEGLLESLFEEGVKGKRILIPRALYGRAVLIDTLENNGADVTLAPVYETVTPKGMNKDDILSKLDEGLELVLTFTSGSTVRNFLALFDESEREKIKESIKIAVISPVTKGVLDKAGYSVDIMPEVYTANNLANAILEYYK
ncbi:uroporphyrinogen-III synthase [Thermodesulfobacteriota bacterium]